MITIQDTIYMGTAAPASGGGGSGNAVWGAITGTLSDQTDLQGALNAKQNTLTAGSNITISNGTISATDTTYSAFGGATSSVAGSAGLVPAPTTSDVDKYLKGDGTWGAVSGGGLQNTATGTDSLTILGTAAANNDALNIGVGTTAAAQSIALGSGTVNHEGINYGTSAGNNSVAIGYVAEADDGISIGYHAVSRNMGIAIGSGYVDSEVGIEDYNDADYGIAIGNCAKAQGSIVIGDYSTAVSESGGSIVIGESATANGLNRMILIGNGAAPVNPSGEPSPGYQFVIGSGERDSQDDFINYLMLDLRTGKIPNDRINGATGSFTSQDGKTVTVTNGVITSIV